MRLLLMLKVRMVPHLSQMGGESGIKRVVEAYFKYLPKFGIELVDPKAGSYDIVAAHAGMLGGECDVAHLHGIYFTADYLATYEEYVTNRNVIQAALTAKVVTVPTSWVAKTFQRDMRIDPEVLPHGIEAEAWKHTTPHEGYVLWNKNRPSDVCNPAPVGKLAQLAPDVLFATTYAPTGIEAPNLKVIGTLPHEAMKEVVQRAAVYLSTTKETFGIGVLEALAAGTPVLGWAFGGNLDLVEHGVTGYLAQPGNYDDLLIGLEYCTQYRDILSANAVIAAKAWSWPNVIEQLAEVYRDVALVEQPVTVGVVIPVYNKTLEQVERAVNSALAQNPALVVVVDDCSENGTQLEAIAGVNYIRLAKNSGVANARNLGIANCPTKYICCLDGDDAIKPGFLEVCVNHLEANRTVGIAYTKLTQVNADGSETVSAWPPSDYSYERAMERYNQVPTCNVFRRKVWERLGGYRQRYAPYGAGEEDAEFWLRIGAIGYSASIATEEPLFMYHTENNRVYNNPNHQMTDYTKWHPWTSDQRHPFASIAKPLNDRSHPVRQYDEPVVSIIIPVAPWHLPYLVDALDSLEAQTYRLWEAICILDGMPQDVRLYARLRKAYPYVTFIENLASPKGPGVMRDIGVKASKGKFLVFLDADDYLSPDFIEVTVNEWAKRKGIIYTDYVDRANWDELEYQALTEDRKLFYNYKTKEAFIRRYSKEYDWNEAIKQPEYNPNDKNAPFYVWCVVTTLLPRAWYDEVGGFDQSMDTWEDVDLHWRLARLGKPYFKVAIPGVVYRFTSGSRREEGQVRDAGTAKKFKERIEYMRKKYERTEPMPCSGCGKNAESGSGIVAAQNFMQMFNGNSQQGGFATMSDEEFVEVLYDHPNQGMHPVVGPVTGRSYDYHSGGESFLVHRKDIAGRPDIFKPIIRERVVAEEEVPATIDVPSPPGKKADFAGVSGVTKETEVKLVEHGIYNAADITKAGKAGLEKAGVPQRVATLILNSAKKAK